MLFYVREREKDLDFNGLRATTTPRLDMLIFVCVCVWSARDLMIWFCVALGVRTCATPDLDWVQVITELIMPVLKSERQRSVIPIQQHLLDGLCRRFRWH